jgi:hypothetical protein
MPRKKTLNAYRVVVGHLPYSKEKVFLCSTTDVVEAIKMALDNPGIKKCLYKEPGETPDGKFTECWNLDIRVF